LWPHRPTASARPSAVSPGGSAGAISGSALPGTEAQKNGAAEFYAGHQTPVFAELDASEQRELDVEHELLDDQRSPIRRTPRRSAASASKAFIDPVRMCGDDTPRTWRARRFPRTHPRSRHSSAAAGDAHAPLTFFSRMRAPACSSA
jgi:hypothetical protein